MSEWLIDGAIYFAATLGFLLLIAAVGAGLGWLLDQIAAILGWLWDLIGGKRR